MFTLIQRMIPARLLASTFFRFAFIGGVGFLVDSLVFICALYGFHLTIISARIIAFLCAATATWFGNRLFTFTDQLGNPFMQWGKYLIAAGGAAMPNMLVFSLLLNVFDNCQYSPLFALIGGILTGMCFNYLFCIKWIFAEL